MFTLKYHNDAVLEFKSMPADIRAKLAKLLDKLEADPRALREPDTKPLGDGLFEIRTMGTDISRGLWVYQAGKQIYMLRFFIKKNPKIPKGEKALALRRLEEMINAKL
ncbi:type II toxin-antitoxin system RelE/ParE family toxin [Acerihabitans sp. TG2]|uniref:type II toxin-antitoxin system RelE/ParE family toxin n=1 Tax=Acerihabitans sp. TG2 TaxID=3096008 RepID=UPI002B23AF32|nr:type II toxin-antitoxin system RelE/ParE family toxin [Acerihabitans sp. TG2]MEA9392492.1 type II toxin-antitoxin system RelE/ParE family toxin [Acerihabitans sp. TG2]